MIARHVLMFFETLPDFSMARKQRLRAASYSISMVVAASSRFIPSVEMMLNELHVYLAKFLETKMKIRMFDIFPVGRAWPGIGQFPRQFLFRDPDELSPGDVFGQTSLQSRR